MRYRVAASAIIIILTVCGSAAAQTRVRVLNDRTTIWRRDSTLAATTVKAGTILEVVAQQPGWYVVLIPPEYGGSGETGLVAVSAVEVVSGSPPPPEPAGGSPAQASTRRVTNARAVEVFGMGEAGISAWLAHRTFDAVLGHSFGPIFGGGIEVHVHDRVFVEGGVEYFQKNGQRVFVSNGAAFGLGIRDTVRIIPVSVTVGYRHRYRTSTAYVGGGAGAYLYRETSDFADPSDNLDERFASYHALAGVEFGGRQAWRTAVEVQFTTVPSALGTNGAANAFDEHNLGGVQVRLKVLGGR
jgi:hypothetical protein